MAYHWGLLSCRCQAKMGRSLWLAAFFLVQLQFSFSSGNRFVPLEERGSPTRLRFTSGERGFYNATIREIEENAVTCNIKIGMYIYDSRTIIRYLIDDNVDFVLDSVRIQDFYLLKIRPKAPLNLESKPLHILKVKAWDVSTHRIVDETKIYLRVTDVNEWTPTFSNKSVHVVLPEDREVGTVAITVHATDKDDGMNGQIYYFIPEAQISRVPHFRVHPQTGEIMVIRPLDFTTKSEFFFHVAARDRAPIKSKQLVSTPPLSVRISIQEVTGYVPGLPRHEQRLFSRVRTGRFLDVVNAQFSKKVYTAWISEIAPPYTHVLAVSIHRTSNGVSLSGAFYGIDQGNEGGNFQIDSRTGLIYTVKDLDYEVRKEHNFSVIAYYRSTFIGRASVQVHVLDGNDHNPEFREAVYKLTVHENTPTGTKILTVSATDRDSGSNGELSYSIANTDHVPFAIVPSSGEILVSGSLDLDRGTIPGTIFLRVRVSDGGSLIRRQSEALVEVSIKPVNDNPPVLKYSRCDLMVDRKTPPGTVVLSIPAIDIDYFSKTTLSYGISYKEIASQVFEVNSSTGQLMVSKSLASAHEDYHIMFSASDGVNPSLQNAVIMVKVISGLLSNPESSFTRHNCTISHQYSQAVLSLSEQRNVSNLDMARPPATRPGRNYHAPEFLEARRDIVTVNEDILPGTEVAKFKAVDKDLGCYGFVLYSIVAGNVDSSFDIDTYNGSLFLVTSLDRETLSSYKLKIRAWDLGKPRNYKDSVLDIVIKDVNDNYPTFSNDSYSVEVDENVNVGHSLLVVHAVDDDEGENGVVTYHLVRDFGGLFVIDQATGLIKVNGSLDYEAQREYWVGVRAMDSSPDDQKIGQTMVHVVVRDVNDNRPVCTPVSRALQIPKDYPPGALVTRINVVDLDSGRGGMIRYKVGRGRNRKLLNIDEESGVVTLNASLVSEKSPYLDVAVIVHDLGSPQLRSRCRIRLHLRPIASTERPVFNTKEYPVHFSISETTAIDTRVITLTAKSPTEADLNYDIVDGSGLGYFGIGQEQGVIKTLKRFSGTHQCHYWLTVQAYDSARPSVFTNLPVLVHIVRKTVMPPYFVPSVYRVRVMENKPSGTLIAQLNAIDPDMGLGQARLRYKIVSGNADGSFSISDNGSLTSTVRLDFELSSFYILNISVWNTQHPTLQSFASVSVSVLDENDHAPKFVGGSGVSSEVKVMEQSKRTVSRLHRQGNPIVQVLAIDRDSGANGFVEYSIREGQGSNKFTIDRYNGQIFSKESLSVGEWILLEVAATDKGTPRKSVSTFLDISIYPRLEMAASKLYFRQGTYTIKVLETTRKIVDPVKLLNLRENLVTDDSVLLFFSIESGNEDGKFFINDAFDLQVVSTLDYEVAPMHKLTVAVTDGIKQATVQVTLLVGDVNDNRPTTSQSFYEVSVMENQEPGEEIITVEGTDLDKMSQGKLLYEIIEGSSPSTKLSFSVGKSSGIIRTMRSFDHELESQHVLTVSIKDQGVWNTSVSIVVNVQDINDHTPEFVPSDEALEVDGGFPVGGTIGRIVAVDEDDGVNAMLKYSILSGNEGGYFYIEQHSGMIHLQQEIVVKRRQAFVLQVEVSDGGYPPRRANQSFEIVAHPKEPQPAFRQDHFTAHVKENKPAGTLISEDIRVEPDNHVFYYMISLGDSCCGNFTVDVFSGLISTKVPLDAERMSSCKFLIKGKSEAGQEQEATILVLVEDVNDNPPTFVNSTFRGSVVEGYSTGSEVMMWSGKPLRVSAEDGDSEENAKISYGIVEQSAQKYFEIDSVTGQLKTATVLDREKRMTFLFHVEARDAGSPQLSSLAQVIVTVLDINDAMPEFTEAVYKALIYRPVYNNTTVLTVSARDADTAAFGNISYELIAHTDIFQVDLSNGVIRIRNADLLLAASYDLTVSASDGIFKNSVPVSVQVTEMPDTKFRFQEESYKPAVSENVRDIFTVEVLQTVGYDVGECVRYAILNENPYFSIDSLSGVLRTKGVAFDREVTPFFALIVQARVDRYFPKVAQTIVNVTIADENDNKPRFTGEPYRKSVDVNTDIGTVLIQLVAVDEDSGKNALVRYRSLSGEDGVLAINETTGTISMRRRLIKGRAPAKLLLYIEAFDMGTPRQASQTVVEFPVVNEDMPVFNEGYNVSVSEGVSTGTVVAPMRAVGPKGRKVYYTIRHGNPFNIFDIDFNTGDLVVIGRLRREVENKYILTVKATDSRTGSWSATQCVVNVLDENNHIPFFEQPAYTADVSENATLGTNVIRLQAIDDDAGVNRELRYSLPQLGRSHPPFAIEEDSGIVTLVHDIDFEKKRSHLLEVHVTDKGNPRLSSFTYLTIRVKDVNDNAPKFEQQEYQFFVDGFWRIGQFLGKVNAVDEDLISDSALQYAMADSRVLKIDSKSGIIYLLSDPGDTNVLKERVYCTDGAFRSSALVSVRFVSANRQAPLLSQATISLSVQEGADPSFVTVVSATDLDQGSFGQIHYTIENRALRDKFHISELTGDLFTKVSFDKEGPDPGPFRLPIRAMDGGGKFDYCEAIIEIKDQNDNAPIFDFAFYKAFVSAKEKMGTEILRFRAEDKDTGVNAQITYDILGLENGNPFELDRTTGSLTLVGEPAGMGYSFMVVATDNGYPMRESRAKVRIEISTSHPFRFENATYNVEIAEDAKPGTTLVTVHASGSGSEEVLEYKIIEGSLASTKVNDKFTIDNAGRITLKSELDYESVQTYQLKVEASVPSVNFAAFTLVDVTVLNLNDNPPVFDRSFYEVSVSEDTSVGTRVLVLIATDKDLDDDQGSSRIRYRFATADEGVRRAFSVDSHTGWVTVKAPLNWETRKSYDFMIKAQDGRKNTKRLTDYTSVRVNIQDVNDSPPVFLHAGLFVAVKEDQIIGQKVAQLLAEDPDNNPVIRYFIINGNEMGLWNINPEDGEITLAKSLDREVKPRHVLEVVAYDGVFRTLGNVVIVVNDTIDNPPVCKKAFYLVKVPEGTASAKPLFRMEVEDPDVTDTVRFSLQGESSGLFMVDSSTGAVSVISDLDYELRQRYRFLVQATDMGGQTCLSDAIVEVSDVNDNAPVFSQPRYVTTVRENASLTVMVARVYARDGDEGTNRKITYSLLGNSNVFSIEETTGVLLLEKRLDKGVIANHSLRVLAKDHGDPSLSSEAAINIIVLGKSDSPPVFEANGYTFNVSESSQRGHEIGTVHAKAASGNRGVVYHLEAGGSKFVQLGANNGAVTLAESVDYELVKYITFTVMASYVGVPSLSSAVPVTVRVTDENDNAPVFPNLFIKRNIDENVRPGTFVASVVATDADEGANGELNYRILSSTPNLPFVIDEVTGTLTVGRLGQVDREKVASYRLKVRAEDKGQPKLFGEVTVQIDISDLNDCPPVVRPLNGTVLVPETKPVGSAIYSMHVTDDDLPQNGPPFRFSVVEGDRSKFSVESPSLTPNVGDLIVKGPLLVDTSTVQRIKIRVDDSGSPPQSSFAYISVYVVKGSQYAPVIQEPTTFFVHVNGAGPISVGNVRVVDADGPSWHQYRITSGNDDGTFQIDEITGSISGQPRRGVYTVGVEVSDGKFSDSATLKILVNELSDDVFDHSVVVTIEGTKPDDFVTNSVSSFASLLSQVTGSPVENIVLWSVQKGTKHVVRRDTSSNLQTDIALAVRKADGKEFISPGELESIILRNRNTLASKLGFNVNIASPAACSSLPCPRNKKCIAAVVPTQQSAGEKVSGQLLSRHFHIGYQCICQNGRTGPDCSKFDACQLNSCAEGERCVPDGQSYSCECINSQKCNLLGETVTLDGSGYISYTLVSPFDVIFKTIKISFRTEEKEGILFYAQGADYCILEIKGGCVRYRFDYGSGPAVAAVNELQVNDGQWHTVEVKRLGKVAVISLDNGNFESLGKSPGESVKINLNGKKIFFGAGVVDNPQQGGSQGFSVFDGFKGCLRHPTLNDVVLPWTGSTSLVQSAQPLGVRAQCQDSGMCAKIACPYFSECINTLTSYRCECLPGHKGPFCIARVSCRDRPCLNGGQCYYQQIDDKIEYRCRCPPQYAGAQCHTYVGACGSSPCKNGGTCSPQGESFTCSCPPRFMGRFCEIDTSPCASLPCIYGTCQEVGNQFQCNCPLGRRGKTCGYGEYCRRTRCDNGGRCIETLDGPVCKCSNGFEGPFCQDDINECLDSGPPCKHGTCINKLGSYYCNCSRGYSGPTCAQGSKGEHETPALSFLAIILICVVGGLVLVFVVCFICWRCCKCRRDRERVPTEDQTISPSVKYPYGYELATFPMVQPPERASQPPDYQPDDYVASYLDSTVLYDPQQVGSSGDSMSSQADSCLKRPLSDDESEREKLYLRTFDPSPASTPTKNVKRTPKSTDNESLCSRKSERMHGQYHWDYTGIPQDVMVRSKHQRKMSEEGSHLGTPLTEAPSDNEDGPDDDDNSCYMDETLSPQTYPVLAARPKPESRRSSLRDDEEINILVPQIPKHIGLSRQSLPKTDSGSPSTVRSSRVDRVFSPQKDSRDAKVPMVYYSCPGGKRRLREPETSDYTPYESFKTQLTTNEFKNRYSLTMDDDSHSLYLQDVLGGGYPAPPSETCPSDIDTCTKPSLSETHSDTDIPGACSRGMPSRYGTMPLVYEVATITSYSSDDDDDDDAVLGHFDHDNPRQLEKDLKALIRDVEERTNAEM